MLSEEQIKKVAEGAASTAASLLSLGRKYTIAVINDPSYIQDGLFGSESNEIIINLATLEPYPQSSYPLKENATAEQIQTNEEIRYALKVCFITFHEIRHLYQKWAVEVYTLNRMLGAKSFPQPESDKKSELWKQELATYQLGDGLEWDIEEDAETFARYMIHRYPVKIEMRGTSRRMGVMKRRYDRVEIHA